jgi:mono/diheme cytochrome c family protein
MRWPMKVWNSLNLDPARTAGPVAIRGMESRRYLVQGPGHCGACHTPRDWTLAGKKAAPLRGATMHDEIAGGGMRDWFAVDLAATRQGLGAWELEDIVGYLANGASDARGSFGPMNPVIENSTSHLSADDQRAIATYLKSLAGADYAGEAVSAEAAASGRPLYDKHCRECHGPSGRGGIFEGPPLAGSAVVQGEDPASLINVILHGSDRPPGSARKAGRRCRPTRRSSTTGRS